MEGQLVPANGRRSGFHFHPDRNKLLAEAHARPSTPLQSPTLATRLSALSLEEDDWAHMVALCRRLGVAEPSRESRWCSVDAGSWRLRWERHTEFSTWTFYRPLAENTVPAIEETALDLAPQDWLGELPGEILVASHIILLRERPPAVPMAAQDEIAARIVDGKAEIFTDFRPGPDLFTRIHLIQPVADAVLAGRLVCRLFEIETYRLLALLAFPLAAEAGALLSRMEAEVALADLEVSKPGSIEADRELLKRLASLAGEAQALSGRTSFRFAAARAYYGLVQERIEQLRESRLEGRPTIAEFMERRLAPAMRTCVAVAERLQGVIAHISTTSQLLNTRVDVAAEITNASLLASVDRRARLQLRLQQTVEGLSVAAISYYALGLLSYAFKAISELQKNFDPAFATGVAAPFVIALVWWALHRARRRMMAEDRARHDRRPAVNGG
jgi:uncharacterized membrane-anchored protein